MSAGRQAAGVLLVIMSLLYLWTFVPRGWVPHDEGMLGQSAEQLMAGRRPHVDYEEPYTGGLTLLHAASFRALGIDLVHLRWVLFAAAAMAQFFIYAVLRRFLDPVGAASGAWLALAWSFPNYFASLPSWWVLICAIASLWALIRFFETRRLPFACAAGLAAGLAAAFKQTGVYIVVALALALLFAEAGRTWRTIGGTVAVLLAVAVFGSHLRVAEAVYLLAPVAACSVLLMAGGHQPARTSGRSVAVLSAALACASLPVLLLALPYAIDGQMSSLVHGLVVAPQKRFEFARLAMGPAMFIAAGVPFIALVTPVARRLPLRSTALNVGLATGAVVVLGAALYRYAPYQLIWQSGRGFAALLPVAACLLLFRDRVLDPAARAVTFAAVAMLAWASLVQFPYSSAIYFCYAAPLAVIAGAAMTARFGTWDSPPLKIWCAALFVLAVVSMNRGYLDSLGAWHRPVRFDRELNLTRAHLRVSREQAAAYGRLIDLVEAHAGDGRVFAGPDAPEILFLAGRLNPSGVIFDFFTDGEDAFDPAGWRTTSMMVVNHAPQFSPRLSGAAVDAMRREFPNGERVDRFEVRWR